MTKEEFMKKYGDVEVKFDHYYKYVFTFSAKLPDGSSIEIACGGNAGDIYRFEASADMFDKVRNLEPVSGGIYKDYQSIEGFDDY